MVQPKYHLSLNRDTDWRMNKPHFHEDIEILLSLSSGGEFFIENELYPINENSLFLFNEVTIHKSIARSPYARYVLHISSETLRYFSTKYSDILGFIRKAPVRCTVLDKAQTEILVGKLKELDRPTETGFCADIRKTMLLVDVVTSVISAFSVTESEEKLQTPALSQVSPILHYIQTNVSAPISLDSLAARFFISKYYMCHRFKNTTGLTIMDYIINCRILKARELLRQGFRVQEVSERVGFRNNAHFIRTFGALTGISPKQYAKKYINL
ncbi:MAG: AraC family transcriptional regulator [Spirochaetaceae bacterium]|jgi:AraC-like DNA-binding protein|nr:AraC family transcriptional regulator [Spirochaetaceae bacterium]